MKNSPYKCGDLPNSTVTNSNNLCLTFLKYVRMPKPLVLIPIVPNLNINLNNCDVINCNDISTYDQAYDSHGELTVELSMVITR